MNDAPERILDERGSVETMAASRAKHTFTLVRFKDVLLAITAAYLVKGIIPREGLVVIWGPPKCGKSFWCLDLVMHIALGRDYRGRRVKQGPVVYAACEGERGLNARVAAFRKKHNLEGEDPAFYLVTSRLDLAADRQALIDDIKAQLPPSVNPSAIVIDTLNRSIAGSESSDEDMGAYIKAADAIREAFACAVLVVHHCGIDDRRPRGHTSLTGAVDAQIAITRDSDGLIAATVEYLKDGPDGAEGAQTASRLDVVEIGRDEDGEQITSCVVTPADGEEPAVQRKRLTPRQHQARDVLRNCLIDAGEPSPGGANYPTGARVVSTEIWREALLQAGVVDREGKNPRTDFRRLLAGLQDRGVARMWGKYVWPSE